MSRKSLKTVVKEAIQENGLYAKVKPSDGKLTFAIGEPQGALVYTKLTAAKATKVVNIVFAADNPKDYSYILGTLALGNRNHQGVLMGNQIHEQLLAAAFTKAKATEIRSAVRPSKQPKAAKKTTGRKTSKKGTGRKTNAKSTKAVASGNEQTLGEIRELLQQLAEKVS